MYFAGEKEKQTMLLSMIQVYLNFWGMELVYCAVRGYFSQNMCVVPSSFHWSVEEWEKSEASWNNGFCVLLFELWWLWRLCKSK